MEKGLDVALAYWRLLFKGKFLDDKLDKDKALTLFDYSIAGSSVFKLMPRILLQEQKPNNNNKVEGVSQSFSP